MKCMICQEKCDGKLIIRERRIVEPVICCSTCFSLWVNQDYTNLTKRIKIEKKKNDKKI